MKYYIIKNLPAHPQDMLDGPRVVECKNEIELQFDLEVGEGPYKSLKDLRKKSLIFKSLIENNPKRAEKICHINFLIKPKSRIIFPKGMDEDYEKIIYRIMVHSKLGKVERKGVKGIHLYNEAKVRIREVVNEENMYGIFSAKIDVYNKNNNRWITKDAMTTFFPIGWDLQTLILSCYLAFRNKVKITNTEYIGITSHGFKVKFIYSEEGDFKTIYPIYEKD